MSTDMQVWYGWNELLDIPSAFQPIVLGSAILLAMGLERMRASRQI